MRCARWPSSALDQSDPEREACGEGRRVVREGTAKGVFGALRYGPAAPWTTSTPDSNAWQVSRPGSDIDWMRGGQSTSHQAPISCWARGSTERQPKALCSSS